MSAPTRWHATKRGLELGDDDRGAYAVLGSPNGIGVRLFFYWPGELAGFSVYLVGRSAAYIDRLARDWIGHGVSPTRTGGRGVGLILDCCGRRDVSAFSRPLYGGLHPKDCIHSRWWAAERRAARVVSR